MNKFCLSITYKFIVRIISALIIMNFFGNLAKKYIQKNDESPETNPNQRNVEELQKKIEELTVIALLETKHRTSKI